MSPQPTQSVIHISNSTPKHVIISSWLIMCLYTMPTQPTRTRTCFMFQGVHPGSVTVPSMYITVLGTEPLTSEPEPGVSRNTTPFRGPCVL